MCTCRDGSWPETDANASEGGLRSGEEAQPPTDGLGLLDQAATHRRRDAKVDAKLGDELRVDRDGLAADLVEVLLAEHHLRSVCRSAESV